MSSPVLITEGVESAAYEESHQYSLYVNLNTNIIKDDCHR